MASTGTMMESICCLGAVAALLLAGLLAGSQATVSRLSAEFQQAQAARDDSRKELRSLERRTEELVRDREEDRAVLGQVWAIVQKD